MDCRNSMILDLCAGSTREKRRERATACFCSARGRSSNSRPEQDLPVVSSSSVNTPIRLQIASAVAYEEISESSGKGVDNTVKEICPYLAKLLRVILFRTPTLLSPVMTMTRIPAARHLTMESNTSLRGGSNMPTTPTKHRLVSQVQNLPHTVRLNPSFWVGYNGSERCPLGREIMSIGLEKDKIRLGLLEVS